MRPAQSLRDEEFGEGAAQHVGAGMAEGALRRRIELGDAAVGINGDDAVQRGPYDGAGTRLTVAQHSRSLPGLEPCGALCAAQSGDEQSCQNEDHQGDPVSRVGDKDSADGRQDIKGGVHGAESGRDHPPAPAGDPGAIDQGGEEGDEGRFATESALEQEAGAGCQGDAGDHAAVPQEQGQYGTGGRRHSGEGREGAALQFLCPQEGAHLRQGIIGIIISAVRAVHRDIIRIGWLHKLIQNI